jgi:hypothetical protein
VLHRTAMVRSGETVLVHGAAGRVGIAELELGAVAGVRLFPGAGPTGRPGHGQRAGRGRRVAAALPLTDETLTFDALAYLSNYLNPARRW